MPNGSNSTPKNLIRKPRSRKKISSQEKKFVHLIVEEGLGAVKAARMAFDWACEPGSSEYHKAVNLIRAPRVAQYKLELTQKLDRELTAQQMVNNTSEIELDNLRQFIYRRLEFIRDNPKATGQSRFKAIQALEKMADPAADINLIMMWADMMWRSAMVHCPCCHGDFPLSEVKNEKIEKFRQDNELPAQESVETLFERRMLILKKADNRKVPHPGQVKALSALERNIAGLGAARSGKSFLLAMMALLAFMIPGVEVWILARTYSLAGKEVEYLQKFLETMFYPYAKYLVTSRYDNKTEELTLESKWGSTLKIRSAKAKGTITASELEFAGIAEPGWVPDDIFNHLRARMTSRLGRIALFGTPQGFGGLLGRFVNMTGRDAKGRARRISPEERTIAAGCPWNLSLLKYTMDPTENPEYVTSELDAARQELTEDEFASEFEGLMSSAEGALFTQLQERHLTGVPRSFYEKCKMWVLGVDQGTKNFAAVLLGWDGETVVAAREYFDSGPSILFTKMQDVRDLVPGWIRRAGGNPDNWKLTIFDVDPPILNELELMEEKGRAWPTEVTFRIKDKKGTYTIENWRKETYAYLNRLARPRPANLYFDVEHCDFLHDQLLRAQARPDDEHMRQKGWILNDPMRGDHVPDAFIMALFTIMSGQIGVPDKILEPGDAMEEAKRAFEYNLKKAENEELKGYAGQTRTQDDIFEEVFGRPRAGSRPKTRSQWHYKDY